jgi:2,5-furandicarboxylate decarboxylase 1
MSPGPVADLRGALDRLAASGLLARVDRTVDRTWEVTAVLDRLEREHRLDAVRFASVAGFPGWSIAGNVFASRAAIAALLGVGEAHLTEELAARLDRPVEPEVVDDGPVHEHVLTGEAATLDAVPLPTHHERDAGPYVSLGLTFCRDPDTGRRNVGIYRFMQRSARELVPSLTSISNIADIFRRQEARGEPLEIAIVPGASPLLALAATYRAPLGVDECALAGGIAGEPLRLVPGRTVDVEVPADAEVVIEARILPGARYTEAPFADMSRSYSRTKRGPLVEVLAVTHREEPILQLAFSGHPDATNMAAVCQEVAVWRAVRQSTPALRAVHVPASGYGFHCYLALEKSPTLEGNERGEQWNAMLAALGSVAQLKLVAAFDHDVDVFDDTAVLGALARRFQAVDPATGRQRLLVVPQATGATYDPSSLHREYPNAKVMLDATLPADLSPEQRSSFSEARCAGSDGVVLADYLADDPGGA